MNISFSTKKIREICEKEYIAKQKFGEQSAKKLKIRLADLLAVNFVTELVAGNPHPLKGDKKGEFSLSLAGGHRLVFISDMDSLEKDWAKVAKIKIVYIGDYHD